MAERHNDEGRDTVVVTEGRNSSPVGWIIGLILLLIILFLLFANPFGGGGGDTGTDVEVQPPTNQQAPTPDGGGQ